MLVTKNLTLGTLATLLLATATYAQYDLRVSEIWMGNEPGSNLTSDWIEVTNFGDTAWVAASDGGLWFDDNSFDPESAAPMMGVDSIGPGESAVFVDGDDGTGDNVTEFNAVWSTVAPISSVGSYDGAGLGQSGDGAGIWVSVAMPVLGDAPLDTAEYPSAELTGGQSWDVGLAAFSTVGNASGAVATTAVNDEGQWAVGSPGSVVPEPSVISLIWAALGFLGLFRSRVAFGQL